MSLQSIGLASDSAERIWFRALIEKDLSCDDSRRYSFAKKIFMVSSMDFPGTRNLLVCRYYDERAAVERACWQPSIEQVTVRRVGNMN